MTSPSDLYVVVELSPPGSRHTVRGVALYATSPEAADHAESAAEQGILCDVRKCAAPAVVAGVPS